MADDMRKGRVVRASRLSAQRSAGTRRTSARSSGRRGGATRTVVKANYGRTRGGAAKAFASANYMMFRPGHDGEVQRVGHDGVREYQPHEVHTWLGQEAKEHGFFYRVVLSPGNNFGEEAMMHWANRVMRESGHDHYMVFVHAGDKGHTERPHVHVLLMTNTRLEREDFRAMRQTGDQVAYEVEIAYRYVPHMSWERWQEIQAARQVERVQDQADARASGASGRTGKVGISSKGQDELGESGGRQEEAPQRRQQMDFDL